MTAYSRTTVPTDINTIEREIVRLIYLLKILNPMLQILEEDNRTEKQAQTYEQFNPEGKLLFIGRVTIELDPLAASNGSKKWMAAKEISQGVVPATFLA
jgi:predicted nucleic-acid-binding protein